MTCKNCGLQIEDGSAFCPYCGAKVEPIAAQTPQPTWPAQGPGGFYVPEKKHLTVGNWVLRYLINFIPCVGSIVFIIMLFVWSFDDRYDDTSRNWAKASLIFTGVSLVLVILYLIIMVALGNSPYLWSYMVID